VKVNTGSSEKALAVLERKTGKAVGEVAAGGPHEPVTVIDHAGKRYGSEPCIVIGAGGKIP
jgi:hypothetical protein